MSIHVFWLLFQATETYTHLYLQAKIVSNHWECSGTVKAFAPLLTSLPELDQEECLLPWFLAFVQTLLSQDHTLFASSLELKDAHTQNKICLNVAAIKVGLKIGVSISFNFHEYSFTNKYV